MSAVEIVEHRAGRLRWLAGAALERAGVRHGFTLRAGGASRGAFSSLNFSSREGDLPERVRENWRRLEAAAGLPARGWALVSQVHGARVELASGGRAACHSRRRRPRADAIATGRSAVTLGVLTADCLPVVLALPGGAVAVAHAGWRGTVAGVTVAALREVCALAGASPRDVRAVLGPAIGPCCYRVGAEVYEGFRTRWGTAQARRAFAPEGKGWRFDLQAANLAQLREAGVRARAVAAVPLCTCCREELCFSYRREGRTGRHLCFVGR